MSHVLQSGAAAAAAVVAARLPATATAAAARTARQLASHQLRRSLGSAASTTTTRAGTAGHSGRRGAHTIASSRAPHSLNVAHQSADGGGGMAYTAPTSPTTAAPIHSHSPSSPASQANGHGHGHGHSQPSQQNNGHSHSHTTHTPAAKVKGGPTGMSSKVSATSPPDSTSSPTLMHQQRTFHTSTNSHDHAQQSHSPSSQQSSGSSIPPAAASVSTSASSSASDSLDAVDPSNDPMPTVGSDSDPGSPTTSTHAPFLMCLGAAARPKRPTTPTPASSTPPSTTLPHDPTSLNLHTHTGATQLLTPRPLDCGEDAFFALTRGPLSVFGVADGVGGWADLGVDPSLFAWELMRNCRAAAHGGEADPLRVLTRAYQQLLDERRVTAGSATAAVLSFDMRTGVLRTANLGDSGYLIVRTGAAVGPGDKPDVPRAVYRSPEQQHYFNAPYQLSVSPDSVRGNISDRPEQAMCAEHQLQAGDVLIVATDGLFDNCFTSDLLYTVQRELTGPLAAAGMGAGGATAGMDVVAARVTKLARALAVQGREFAMNHRRQSPFARAASSVSGRVFSGGKLDDVTVVTAMVVDAPRGKDEGEGKEDDGGKTTLLYAKV